MDPFQLDIPSEFASERLLMRRYLPSDAPMYLRAIRENWEHLYEFLPDKWEAMQSEADAEAIIQWMDDEWQKREVFIFGIWEKASGAYAGEIYQANADWRVPRIEMGYFIVQASTRRGYASEAARATVRLAFERLGVIRVELQTSPDNAASRGVAENCGMRLECRMRQRHRKKSGEVGDTLWYALLRAEWEDSLTDKT